MTIADRQDLQRLLTRAGFDTQGSDGVIGKNTQAAIRAYQQRLGVEVTGEGAERRERRGPTPTELAGIVTTRLRRIHAEPLVSRERRDHRPVKRVRGLFMSALGNEPFGKHPRILRVHDAAP